MNEDPKRKLENLLLAIAFANAEYLNAALAQQRAKRELEAAESRREKAMDALRDFGNELIDSTEVLTK